MDGGDGNNEEHNFMYMSLSLTQKDTVESF